MNNICKIALIKISLVALLGVNNAVGQIVHHDDTGQTIKIPVVFHVIYEKRGQQLSLEEIQLQITQLNRDFSATNDVSQVIEEFKGIVGNSKIEFYLSNTTKSIIYIESEKVVFGNDEIYYDSLGGSSAYKPDQNLNVWITNLTPGISAWAKNILESESQEGVVIDYDYFENHAIETRELGRTLVHEVGHWLGLGHLKTTDCNVDADGISDTPNHLAFASGCELTEQSCGAQNMTQNFMGYADDVCRLFFTQGQVDSMRYFILEHKSALVKNGINLGTDAHVKQNNVEIFPNPCIDKLRIKSDVEFNKLKMINSLGKIVLNQSFTPRKKIEVEMPLANEHLYFLIISANDQIISRNKIIKQ